MEAAKQAEIGRFGRFAAILNEFAAMRGSTLRGSLERGETRYLARRYRRGERAGTWRYARDAGGRMCVGVERFTRAAGFSSARFGFGMGHADLTRHPVTSHRA